MGRTATEYRALAAEERAKADSATAASVKAIHESAEYGWLALAAMLDSRGRIRF